MTSLLIPPKSKRLAQIERMYAIDHLLTQRVAVPLQAFLDTLDVSLSTFKRDLKNMRERKGLAIEYNRVTGFYSYVKRPFICQFPVEAVCAGSRRLVLD